MPRGRNGPVELEYEVYGDDDGVPLLLVSGLGAQMLSWDLEMVEAFVDRGFRPVRFDNRDVGRSTTFPAFPGGLDTLVAAVSGEPVEVPYRLTDMAADAVAVLDDLGIDRAHVVGRSMGGMIGQTLAIEHPGRVLSLTSIMSTTGEPDVGGPRSDILPVLLESAPVDREGAIEHAVTVRRAIGSPEHFEEDRARAQAAAAFDRGHHPAGNTNQLIAVAASGSRAEGLAALRVPTTVIHGDADPLVDVSGGRRTAGFAPGADLVVLEGMGHDLPTFFWAPVIEAVTAQASRTAA